MNGQKDEIRKKRTPKDAKEKAKHYFVLGLVASDVAKITGINQRTLERHITNEKWKELRTARKEAEKQKVMRDFLVKNYYSLSPHIENLEEQTGINEKELVELVIKQRQKR